ncbi:MAG: hypothetical protein JEZ06_09660 [Anaerolineaceae bacterium]|nr:hypothetical protein [Anaerolineaceae bacterium]
MKKKKFSKISLLILIGISFLMMACLGFGGDKEVQEESDDPAAKGSLSEGDADSDVDDGIEIEAEGKGQSKGYDTDFPLPHDVDNFMDMGDDAINFQTSLPFEESAEFYLTTLAEMGFKEEKLLTVIGDGAFSMVFHGAPNGKVIVVQGVDLNGSTNINIRYEDR